jgi:hypothetical protein
VRRRARAAAEAALERSIEVFEGVGSRVVERQRLGEARLVLPDGLALTVRMRGRGRIFGGSYALEVATTEPVLPTSGGLRARGRGVVRLKRVAFKASDGDEAGAALARRLEADRSLQEALAAVHFEGIRVEGDGRPVIRHMGGSVVWVLFPPLVRPVPLVEEQARAVVAALAEFVAAGRR